MLISFREKHVFYTFPGGPRDRSALLTHVFDLLDLFVLLKTILQKQECLNNLQIIVYFMRPCEIDSLKQTHDTVCARFTHGPTRGQVESLTRHLLDGYTSLADDSDGGCTLESGPLGRVQGNIGMGSNRRSIDRMPQQCSFEPRVLGCLRKPTTA